VKVYRISAITLFVKNMEASCKFYSAIPGFELVCGGISDSFTTYQIGRGQQDVSQLGTKRGRHQ